MRQILTVTAMVVAFPLAIWYGKASQHRHDAEMGMLEGATHVVHDAITVIDTVIKHDTIRLTRTVVRADTLRDTAYVVLGLVDSAATASDSVASRLAKKAVTACSDAMTADWQALMAARQALADCFTARTWADSGRKLAETKAIVIETQAQHEVWSHRRQGAVVGALAALLARYLIK